MLAKQLQKGPRFRQAELHQADRRAEKRIRAGGAEAHVGRGVLRLQGSDRQSLRDQRGLENGGFRVGYDVRLSRCLGVKNRALVASVRQHWRY